MSETRIIRVTCCRECPKVQRFISPSGKLVCPLAGYRTCQHEQYIPDWCPLEKLQEEAVPNVEYENDNH